MRAAKFILIFLLIAGWLYTGWPSINIRTSDVLRLRIPPKIQEAQATALTLYETNTAATTLTTANQLTSTAPASEVSTITIKVGKATGWGTLPSQGTGSNWAAGTSEPAQLGTDFLWDVTTLEGQQILAGNWTPKVKLSVNVGSVVADIHVRVAVRSSGGVYTNIIDAVSTAQTINTTATVYTLPATSGALTNLNTGDKIYQDVILNITTNSTGSATAKFTEYENGGANESVVTPGYQAQPATTYINDDSANQPPNLTIGPGSTRTAIDSFAMSVSAGSVTLNSVTTTLAANTTSSIAKVEITDSAGSTTYGSTTNPTANSFAISLSGLTINTTTSSLRIYITPKSATAMPPPPGSTYTVTSTITGWTDSGGNTPAGSDANSATITIDNQSPADVTGASGTAGNTQVSLSWTTPSSDYATSTVLRATGSAIANFALTEGTAYATGTAITATTTVACVVGGGTGASVGCTDTGLTNGTAYYYKIFSADTYANYATGTVPTGSPFTPVAAATISCSTNVASTDFGTLTTASVLTSSPNASTTMSCSSTPAGCSLYVYDAGNGSSPGLATSSPAYLIQSNTVTLSAGSEGYGIQATTTASGSGGSLGLNTVYNKGGNDVGGLSLSTNTLLASSTVDVSNRETVVTHKAAISSSTYSGAYKDTITYSCTAN